MKKKTSKKKKSKSTTIPVWLPDDVIDFYKRVAKFAGVSLNKALLVVTAIEALKITDAEKIKVSKNETKV